MVPTISHSTNWSANSLSNWHAPPAQAIAINRFTFAVQSLLTPTQLLFAIQRRLERLRIRSTVDPTPSAL